MNPEKTADFRTEFISFLKSRGYPASGIFRNAKIGEINVDYLITLPNSNEKLVIITVQRSDNYFAQLRKQFEMCRQEMGIPNYPICILTPTTKAQSKYPFAVYYLDNIENFQKINFELLPIFQELSLNNPALEQSLSAKEIAKTIEMMNLSYTMETDFQAFSTDTENKKRESFYKPEEKPGYFEYFLAGVGLIPSLILLVLLLIELVSLEYGIAALLTLILIPLLFYFFEEKDDETANYPIPSFTALNSDEIAVLRAGRKGIVHTALFNLCYIKEFLMFKKVKEPYDAKIHSGTEKVPFRNIANVSRCYINNSSTQQPEGTIEKIIYQFAKNNQRPVKAKDFFADLSLQATLDEFMEPIHQKLMQMHLLKAKHDKTTLGKNYLKKLEEHFQSVKYTISDVNPSFIFAIYGLKELDTSKDFSGFAMVLSDTSTEESEDYGGDDDGGGG